MDKRTTSFSDNLSSLDQEGSAADKLTTIHREIQQHLPFIARIAIVIYEEERDLLKTFISSSDDEHTLQYYQSKLSDSHSLSEIARSRQSRVVNDLVIYAERDRQHSQSIATHGYASSFTTPFYNNGNFAGLIFINSYEKEVFSDLNCHQLSPYIHLIGLLICKEIGQVNILLGSVSTALDISHHRDPETGAHLERMSRYTRLIARELAPRYQLSDEYVEFIYRFAPLHDVGKIAIPDRILLKPGKLTDEEFREMKRHTTMGCEIMDRMLSNFRLQGLEHISMLRNIIQLHHEAIDGSGYPLGLKGDNIPLEARIIAVADIFDALTSERPYKKAWSNEEAFTELRAMSVRKLDIDCVEALENALSTVLEIQNQFQDDPLG
jgi:HD-GYP domain-containing protein (c-di-GMP phosphodiesterase class II)